MSDLNLTKEQEANADAWMKQMHERAAEDQSAALRDVGWSSVRDLFDAYGDEMKRAEAAESLLRKAARVVEAATGLAHGGAGWTLATLVSRTLALTPEDREALKERAK